MFSNLENAIIIAAMIWGAVKLIQHFVPDYIDRRDDYFWTDAKKRLEAVEKKLELR